jgi:hypothetical protein
VACINRTRLWKASACAELERCCMALWMDVHMGAACGLIGNIPRSAETTKPSKASFWEMLFLSAFGGAKNAHEKNHSALDKLNFVHSQTHFHWAGKKYARCRSFSCLDGHENAINTRFMFCADNKSLLLSYMCVWSRRAKLALLLERGHLRMTYPFGRWKM